MTPVDFSENARAAVPGVDMPVLPGQAAGTLELHWEAIHEAAEAVAAFAGITPEPFGPEVRGFPQALCHFGGWRRDLARQGVEDLAAIMEPGLAAVLAVHDSGANAAAAAMALWQEFLTARDALLTLAPPVTEDITA